LLILGVVLFRDHLSGAALFVGTSDRINVTFAVRQFSIDGIRKLGYVPAWNETMFLGFALDAGGYLPGLNDPLGYFLAYLPTQHLFAAYGYVTFVVFVLTMWAAYLYIKDCCGSVFAAFVGSGLCALSTYSMLRIGQNDPLAMTLIQMPLGLLAIRRMQDGKTGAWFVGLTAVIWTLFVWSYMQETVYVVILFGCYALYLAIKHGSLKVPILFGASVLVAAILGLPRLLAFYEATHDLARLPLFPTTCSCEFYRWLNDGIFGRYFLEASINRNIINLHEGFQVYASTFSAFLIVLGLFRRGNFDRRSVADVPFHLFILVAVFLIVLYEPVRYLVFLAFLKKDLLHSRFSVDVIVPIGLLTAVYLGKVIADSARPTSRQAAALILVAAGVGGVGAVWAINILAESPLTAMMGLTARPLVVGPQLSLLPVELARVIWSAVFLALGAAIWFACRWARQRGPTRTARLRETLLAYSLGAVILVQVFQLVDLQIIGEETRTFPAPFWGHNSYTAPRAAYTSPSPPAVQAIRSALQTDDYRSIAVIEPGGFPSYGNGPLQFASHVAEFWQLRLINGYNSMPALFASLPWPPGTADARYLYFQEGAPLLWELLALLNVKYAVTVNPALYYNLAGGDPSSGAEAGLGDLQVVENPFPVAPRQFFTRSIRPVDNKTRLLPRDPTMESVVTGLRRRADYPTDGQIAARYLGTRSRSTWTRRPMRASWC
jgi:hypothetical protein